jgi:membrane-associated protease RseP (regulator of RpoE activity)
MLPPPRESLLSGEARAARTAIKFRASFSARTGGKDVTGSSLGLHLHVSGNAPILTAVVFDVNLGTAAAKNGVVPGDTILEVNDVAVSSCTKAQLLELLSQQSAFSITFMRCVTHKLGSPEHVHLVEQGASQRVMHSPAMQKQVLQAGLAAGVGSPSPATAVGVVLSQPEEDAQDAREAATALANVLAAARTAGGGVLQTALHVALIQEVTRKVLIVVVGCRFARRRAPLSSLRLRMLHSRCMIRN